MGTKTVVTVVCDLEHKDETEGSQVHFGYLGEAFDIDLCGPHNKEFREKFGAFADHARQGTRPVPRTGGRRRNRNHTAGIRKWHASLTVAEKKKLGLPEKLADRGRIPVSVQAAYRAKVNESGH